MRVAALTAVHLEGLRALFEAASSPCFCQYWHFEGTKNEWLDRCAHHPEENARKLDTAEGLVALDDRGMVIGWMKLVRRSALPKLRGLPVYRGLDLGDDDATLSVGCFLVHPEHRRAGVARALLDGAEAVARGAGAAAIEGYPRRSSAPLYDEEAWLGPEALFVAQGFAHVAGEAPYPVYRKVLR